MGGIQMSSMVSAAGGTLSPVRTGYEQVIANRCDDRFAYSAKQPGRVESVDDRYIKIVYGDDTRHGIKLGIYHGKVAGAILPHNIVTDLKAGQRFNKDDILTWNNGYFERDILNPGGVSMKGGVMTRVVFIENTDTLEDSSAIVTAAASKLATPSSKVKTILVKMDMAVKNLVRIGSPVELDTVLAAIEEGSISSLASDEEALVGLLKLTGKAPKAKVKGTVSNIEVIYMGDTKDAHPSVQKIIREDNKRRRDVLSGTFSKGAETGEIQEQTFINGSKVTNGMIAITITMDTVIGYGIGDKCVIDNASKTVSGKILTGTNKTEDGKDFDFTFAFAGINNRVLTSPMSSGTTNSALIALGEHVVKAYRG